MILDDEVCDLMQHGLSILTTTQVQCVHLPIGLGTEAGDLSTTVTASRVMMQMHLV
jgi:hypothetical protein